MLIAVGSKEENPEGEVRLGEKVADAFYKKCSLCLQQEAPARILFAENLDGF